MSLRLLILAVVMCCAAGMIACAAPAWDGGPDRVRAVVIPYLNMMPFHVAREEGYFAAQNLDVEFVMLGRTQEIMSALASGEVDAAGGMLTVNEMNLAAAGARVRMIADLGRLDPAGCVVNAVIARRELVESGALQDPERIRQLKVDADIFIGFGYWLDQLLAPMQLTIEDLQLVNVPSTAAVAALESGSIDVTIDSEPWVTQHLATGNAAIWSSSADLAPDYVVALAMYGPTLLDERPEVGERFTVALLQAVRQYRQGKTPRNMEIVGRATGLAREILREACWPILTEHARIDPRVFDGFQQWALDHDLIDAVRPDEMLFDQRFIDHANQELAR